MRAPRRTAGSSTSRSRVFELVPPESLLDEDQQQSLLYSSDLELGETTKRIFEAIEEAKPQRIMVDSLSEIRLLAQSSLRYRRQVLALKHYFARNGATVVMLDDLTSDTHDKTVHSVAHGVIRLEELAPDYGSERRRMRVIKYRGQNFRGGFHDMVIKTGGVETFPRLVSSEHKSDFERETPEIALRRSSTRCSAAASSADRARWCSGPAGTGKSLLALIVRGRRRSRAARRRRCSSSTRNSGLLFERAKGLGFDLAGLAEQGDLLIEQIDAAELAPGEFAQRVRRCVEDHRRAHGHHRQPQRLPGGDAGGKAADPAHARAAAVPEPAGREHLPDGRPARAGRRHESARRRHLSCRHRDPAPLFRGDGPSPPRHLGHQEADQRARRHDPRISHRRRMELRLASRSPTSRACFAAFPRWSGSTRR